MGTRIWQVTLNPTMIADAQTDPHFVHSEHTFEADEAVWVEGVLTFYGQVDAKTDVVGMVPRETVLYVTVLEPVLPGVGPGAVIER